MLDPQFFILIAAGFLISIFAIVIGGAAFLSVPIIQILFPGISFGSVIGNLKIGSLITFAGSTISTRKNIAFAKNIKLAGIAFIGTIIGASFIAHLSQDWIFPAVVLAIIVSLTAPKISQYVSQRRFNIASFICGIYAGLFGAGNGIILLALIRTQLPKDSDIAYVKTQVRFIELLLAVTAVFTHFFHGNLITAIWLPWSMGAIFGGYIGGMILNKLGHLSGKKQKIVLYISFFIAFTVAFYNYYQ